MTITRVAPCISSDRVAATRRFYIDLFGFQVATDSGSMSVLVAPDNPAARIVIVRTANPGRIAPPAANASPVSLTIEVDDVDELHARAVAHKHPIVSPLAKEPWGVRRFQVKDPNGIVIEVASPLEVA